MRGILTVIVCLLAVVAASAQQPKKPASSKVGSGENAALANALEAKIRKAWEDYKRKDKVAFYAILANDFGEVTNDADAIFGKDTELKEMDEFDISQYKLSDFKLRPVGSGGAVMTYIAEYSGKYANADVQMKAVYGEVWVKVGSEWKVMWVQETKVK
jgi:hypothetical protein